MKVVVFDDVLCRRQAEYAISGLELRFYAHADDAVAVVERERPAVVLMDYSMEAHCSGVEAIVALRAACGKELAIVGISSDRRFNEQMLDAGADDALPKTHLRGYLSRLAQSASSDSLADPTLVDGESS